MASDNNNNVIRLRHGNIDVQSTPRHEFVANELSSNEWRLYLVTFNAHLKSVAEGKHHVERLLGHGIKLTEYIPDNSFLVYAPPSSVHALDKLRDEIVWIGPYIPEYKIDRRLHGAPDAPTATKLRVMLAKKSGVARSENEMEVIMSKLAQEIVDDVPEVHVSIQAVSADYIQVEFTATKSQVSQVAQWFANQNVVTWVEPVSPMRVMGAPSMRIALK